MIGCWWYHVSSRNMDFGLTGQCEQPEQKDEK